MHENRSYFYVRCQKISFDCSKQYDKLSENLYAETDEQLNDFHN